MANKKITDLPDIGTPDNLDILEIVDVSTNESKHVKVKTLKGAIIYDLGVSSYTSISQTINNWTQPLKLDIANHGLPGDSNPGTLIHTTIDGIFRVYSFIGNSGVYGSGPDTATEFDFQLLNSESSNLIREEFTWTTGPQTFTLADDYSQVYSVEVQGQGALHSSQYTLVAPNQVTILDTLESGDYVIIIYSSLPTGTLSYYTQSQVDAMLATKKRTFTIFWSWTGTFAANASVYTPDRESGHMLNPTMTVGNSAPGLVVPFPCKLIAAKHAGNALGSSLTLSVFKKTDGGVSTPLTTAASIALTSYSGGVNYDLDLVDGVTFATDDFVIFGFLNPTTSTGVWRTPSLTLLFEEI